jgi:hypothetical protein
MQPSGWVDFILVFWGLCSDRTKLDRRVGIRNREKRVADIVVRELKRAKPDVWGCVQAREVWSTEEETHRRSGHFWIRKFGTVPGSMNCVEKKFESQVRKWEEFFFSFF